MNLSNLMPGESRKKISRLLCITALSTCSVFAYAQQQQVKLTGSNLPLKSVFKQIEKQTDLSIDYRSQDVDDSRIVKQMPKATTVQQAMNQLLAGTDCVVTFSNGHIIIKKQASNTTNQQSKQVKGTIVDATGMPVIGANVMVKGTTNGTITDMDGNFSLEADNNAILIVSYIGFANQEIKVGNQTNLSITMKEDAEALDEVVVVGYGTQKKVNLTGAVSSLNGDDITKTKNENVYNMLTGKIPGVQVKQNSMEPGSYDTSVQIRGMGQPLIIIDGVPRDNMAKLDPNEIESISVLKDGSAAIYGVRAANGVLLIKTKQGKVGDFKVDYSGSVGLQQLTKYPETLSGWEYMVLTNEHSKNKGGDIIFSEEEIQEYKSGLKKDTDWGRCFINNVAPITQHSISASGGSEKIDYFVNFGYLNQMGHYKSKDKTYEKYNIRSNVGFKLNKDLKLELLLNAMMDEVDSPNYSTSVIHHGALMHIPILPLYANNNPDYLQHVPGSYNPIAMSEKDISGYRKDRTKLFQSSMILSYNIPFIKGLKAKALYNYDYYTWENKHFKKEYTLYEYDQTTDQYNGYKAWSPSVVLRSFRDKITTLFQTSLDYNVKLADKHSINALVLYEETYSEMDNFTASRELSLDAVDQIFAGNTTNQQATQNMDQLWKIRNRSIVGRVNYDYLSKYLFEFAFRYDGSSKFAKGKQWGFFPSVNVGWRISEEKFWKENKILSKVDNFKLRATYGRMGDDSASSYQYLSGFYYPNGGYVLDNAWINAIKSKGAPNPNITWFIANTYNVGLDASLWKGLLGFQVDYFIRDRSGLLAKRNLTLPGTVGIGLPEENLESDQTKGIEVSLSHFNKVNDFTYSINTNLSFARTSWKYKERARSGNSYLNWRENLTNRPNNIWWGYGANGQFTSMEDIWSSPNQDGKGNSIARPGDYKYEDWNEDGIIDDNDVRPIANTNYPLLNYGISLFGEYKGFDLNLLFQGAAGVYVKYDEQLRHPLLWDRGGLAMFMDRWHMEDPTADPQDPNTKWIPGHFPSSTVYAQSNNYDRDSEFNIENAAYLRLKSVELGYTLPSVLLNKVGIEKLRLFINGYNLLTFTRLKYTDPEQPNGRPVYPFTVTYNFGVNLTF